MSEGTELCNSGTKWTKTHDSGRSNRTRRSGVAAVEFAVCLPVILLLVFGSIEASSYLFLKQSLSVACYEATRAATGANATEADAAECGSAILDSRGVSEFDIQFPSGVDDLERGEQVVCEVTAPTQPNSPLAGNFISNRTLLARIVMIKE